MRGPLAGLRVIDLTTVIMGPYASMMLADMGADVIKIESPEGDTTRQAGRARHPGMGAVFLTIGRGKRSLVLDLKQPGAVATLKRLVQQADVFLINMRPDAAARLGIDYAAISACNPRIVYCSAQGFLAGGPYSGEPAYDDMIQGLSGTADILGRIFGEPAYVPMIYADKVMGLNAALAIMMALFRRERSGSGGTGEFVEVPMFEGMAAFTLVEHLYDATFAEPGNIPGYPRVLTRERRPFRTSDGYLCALPYTDKHFQRFFDAAGRADLKDDARFSTIASRIANVQFVYQTIAAIIVGKTSAEWMTLLRAADIPCMPMNSLESLLEDPHLAATHFFRSEEHPTEGRLRHYGMPFRFEHAAAGTPAPAPRLGEHSEAVLREAGFGADEISALRDTGALIQAP